MRAVVNDPDAVRRVFLDNAANYRKDALQLRVLRPGLGTGLLTADGEDWRVQRRALAPLFSPRQVADFAPAMHRVARAAAARYAAARDGRVSDVAADMARVTLEVLEQTLFSQGLARGAEAFQQAVTRYFETFGRLDPLDLVGAPQFLPRFWRLRGRATLRLLPKGGRRHHRGAQDADRFGSGAPNDLLTLLLRAQDPQTGRAISEEDVRANIVTFIGAGHETTANALTWTLYLLSQAPQWRARAEAEVDAAFDPESSADPGDSLPVVKAVLEEALRLYPPAAFLSREAIAEDWLAGARVPAGTIVTVAPFVLHRHRQLWKDPDAFDPERFLGDESRADRSLRLYSVRRRSARVHRHELRDAGGGHRARASPPRAALRSRAGARRRADPARDPAPALRHENDRAPPRAVKRDGVAKIFPQKPFDSSEGLPYISRTPTALPR